MRRLPSLLLFLLLLLMCILLIVAFSRHSTVLLLLLLWRWQRRFAESNVLFLFDARGRNARLVQ